MNLNSFKDAVQRRIADQMDGCLSLLTGNSVRPANAVDGEKNTVVIPAKTLEEIAIETVHANSMIRAYQMAHRIVQEEFDKVMKPSQPMPEPVNDDGTSNDPSHEGGIYGV